MTARNEFSVRVTSDDVCDNAKWLALWGKLGGVERALVCKEVGEETSKLHAHAYVKTCTSKHDSDVRYHVSKVFGVQGADLSVKDPNKGTGSTDACLRYICKGEKQGDEPCMVVRLGISVEDAKEYHAAYWAINRAVVSTRAASAVKKPSMYDELRAFTTARGCETSEDVIRECLVWAKEVRRGVHFVSFANAVALLCHQMDEPGEFAYETKLRDYVFGFSAGSRNPPRV